MFLTLTVSFVAVLCLLIAIVARRARNRREMLQHSITPEALHALMAADPKLLLFDVRQPLDLLVDSEIIPGATRLPPRDVIENPSLIPRDADTIVYCTCPSEKTSRSILHRALSLDYLRVRFLRGGLAAWKAKGYPVEPYNKTFHLDTGT